MFSSSLVYKIMLLPKDCMKHTVLPNNPQDQPADWEEPGSRTAD